MESLGSSGPEEWSADGLVNMAVGDIVPKGQIITEVDQASKCYEDRRVLEEDTPKRKEHAVQGILRISGLSSRVTQKDLLKINRLAGNLREPPKIFINADSVGSATAHLEFTIQHAAQRVQTAFRSSAYVQREYPNCQVDVFFVSPPSVSGVSADTAGRSSRTDFLPFPKSIMPQIHLPFASEDTLVGGAASHPKDGTKYWGVSATGQWQPAQRDPRHALQASISGSGGPSPHAYIDGTSPAMCLVEGTATSDENVECRTFHIPDFEIPLPLSIENPMQDAVRIRGADSGFEVEAAMARDQLEDDFSLYPISSTSIWREL